MSKQSDIAKGINAARRGDYLKAINLLTDAYASGQFDFKDAKSATALSYYALCLALVQKKHKEAIDLCRKTIDLNFYVPDLYANLARVYMAAPNRKKAVEAIGQGLKACPGDPMLSQLRAELGIRARPVIPFLLRENPVNKALGRTRAARKGKSES